MGRLREGARRIAFAFPALLARLGIVDREHGDEAFDLALPVMVTGALRTFLRTADFLMVGQAVGASAVAALELGFQYYFIPFGLSLALTSGTISAVSRFVGAGQFGRANTTVAVSLWLSLAFSIPMTAVAWVYAEPLVAVLAPNETVTAMGATYLRIVMLSVAFRFWSMTAARALAGAGDTRTPMYVRLLTLPTNIGLNAVLIFGLGPVEPMGVAGAAWGTVAANVLAAGVFLVLLSTSRFPVRLPLPGSLPLSGRLPLPGRSNAPGVSSGAGGDVWDSSIAREVVRVGLPLAGTRLSRTFGRFPFLFVLGAFGTGTLAAYAIGRRVMLLAMMPAWGYSTAASTLVGQRVGEGDGDGAAAAGWATLRVALATQLCIAVVLVVLARPISLAFGSEHVADTVRFVRVFGLGVGAFAVSRTMRGGLRGAGDTTWPFYGTLAGTYLLKLPVVFLALPATLSVGILGVGFTPGIGLGVPAVYAAILLDMHFRAVVNAVRFKSGAWRAIARASDVGADASG
ncbi:MATE family efflux transporter [Halorubellus sp. JP-L1]|uniref:MATE family efflux transporter n=1 Tax=Halorubellus sp. JP-L1 TaxID=2715753 RepID=UPI00140772FF|nr:MATE family efflux transporter [Halorubellus sp. JP-L1]NHN43429.1 MATE family efflux transporter [Halorubellus sp. JP-L1]